MKRSGNLWPAVISFPSLFRAARKARRGKRFRPDVAQFEFDLERNLWRLHEELQTRSYQPGAYHTFLIYEPKQRQISAAPYRDRVVHHALAAVLESVFEPAFVTDSYACRKGKGTHAAVDRAQQYARRFRYVLKTDVRKFFPSVDHGILISLIERKIKDPNVMWLVNLIVDASNEQEPVLDWFPGDDLFDPAERRRGLPIGNQTSQFFANAYLNPLDHFIRESLQAGGYVRYADDMLVFSDDKRELALWRTQITEFLYSLRLKLHPRKSEIFPVACGIPFLGYRVFPTHRQVSKSNVRRFRRRVHVMQSDYAAGRISLEEIRQRMISWLGHARQGSSSVWQEAVFANIRFGKGEDR